MFEDLKKFSKILVSGPQRSGTTICTKMIATDTGHKFLSQSWLVGDSPISKLKEICLTKKEFVIQCPGESFFIDQLSANDTLIVFMIRDIKDIILSQVSHEWSEYGQKKLYKSIESDQPISAIKYKKWSTQKEQIKNWLEIEYGSLSDHELFVPKEKRTNWHIRQIDIDNKYQDEIS